MIFLGLTVAMSCSAVVRLLVIIAASALICLEYLDFACQGSRRRVRGGCICLLNVGFITLGTAGVLMFVLGD